MANAANSNEVEMLDASLSNPSPISGIPPEILINILLLSLESPDWYRPSASLTLMLVSKYWKKLVLGTPDIWAIIETTDIDTIKVCMARSGQALLEVHIGHEPDADEPLTTILASLWRIRRLALYVDSGDDDDRIEDFDEQWASPAPHLDDFDIHGITLPRELFSRSAPPLRKLSIHRSFVHWDTFPDCPYLEKLEIASPDNPISLMTLLQRLQKSPHLKKLAIEEALGHPEPPDGLRRAQLLELAVIEVIRECADLTAKLLNHLTIPEGARIQLEVRNESQPTSHLHVTGALQRCRKPASWLLRSLSIFADKGAVFSNVGFSFPHNTGDHVTQHERNHRVTFFRVDDAVAAATQILEYLTLSRLESLDLAGNDIIHDVWTYPEPPFWTMLASLPCLQSLSLHHLYALGFAEYWTKDATRTAYSRSTNPPFPSLLHFTYEEVRTMKNPARFHKLESTLKYLNDTRGTSFTTMTVILQSRRGGLQEEASLNRLKSLVQTLEVKTILGLAQMG